MSHSFTGTLCDVTISKIYRCPAKPCTLLSLSRIPSLMLHLETKAEVTYFGVLGAKIH